MSTKELLTSNVLIFHQVEFAPPVGYVEPERQERREEKKEEEVQCLLEYVPPLNKHYKRWHDLKK